MAYNNPTPVSAGIIESTTPGNLLFVERADGGLALCSGYVDELEDGFQAINREVEEEMGMFLDGDGWELFYHATNKTNKLLLFCFYKEPVAMPTDFVPNKEVVALHDLPWDTPLKFPFHMEAVRRWRAKFK